MMMNGVQALLIKQKLWKVKAYLSQTRYHIIGNDIDNDDYCLECAQIHSFWLCLVLA